MSTPSENEPRDDPKSTKLPPANPGPSAKSGPAIPTEGVSPQIKIFVIGMTFLTIMAFGVFAALMIKKIFLKEGGEETWGPQLLTIAEQLKDRGLRQEALEHYQRYLDTQTVNLKARAGISMTMAHLHLELGQCNRAVVTFLHAQAAQPSHPEIQTFESKIQSCRSQTPTSE